MTIFRRRENGQPANLLKISSTVAGATTDLTLSITDIETMLGPVGTWRLERKSAIWAGNLRRYLVRKSGHGEDMRLYRVKVAITRNISVPVEIYTNSVMNFDELRLAIMRMIGVPLVKLVEDAQSEETVLVWFEEWVLETTFDEVEGPDAGVVADYMAMRQRRMRSTPELTHAEWDIVVAEADELPSSEHVFSLFERPVGGYPEVAWFADTMGRLV